MDAIDILKAEHKAAKKAMEEIAESSGDKRGKLFLALKQELEMHDRIEEQIFYPTVQSHPKASSFPALDKKAHQEIEAALEKLERLPVAAAEWLDDFKAMQRKLLAHVADEENRLFVIIRTQLSQMELDALGGTMKSGKTKAMNKV
jgi:iron-sulfur cluster repair protein YtfE (RIC family)